MVIIEMKIFIGYVMYECVCIPYIGYVCVCVCSKFENFNKIIFYLYNQIEWQDEK